MAGYLERNQRQQRMLQASTICVRTQQRRTCLNFKLSHALSQFLVFFVARLKLEPLCRDLRQRKLSSQSNVAHMHAGRHRRLGAGRSRAHLELELVHLELASARLVRHPLLDFLGPFLDFLVDLANRKRSVPAMRPTVHRLRGRDNARQVKASRDEEVGGPQMRGARGTDGR
jgi:hypothetical protein